MQPHRLMAGLAGAVLLLGIAVVSRSEAGVSVTAGAAERPTRTAPAAPRPLFAGQLLVYTNDALTATQVTAVREAAHADVAAVATREEYLASGKPSFPDIPVQAMVSSPTAYAAAVGRPQLATALAGGAVLAATEARLRRLDVGGTLRFSDGRRVRVTAVVDDHVLGGNELSLPAAASSRRPGGQVDYLLVADRGDPATAEKAIRSALGTTKVRVLTKTENGYFSSADRVLTQLQVKALFGEFAMRRTGLTTFEQDPTWVDRYLVTKRITQLGVVTCNRGIVRALSAAMTEITRRDLGAIVHTADFQWEGGCWNPNIIPGDNGTISRHSWGIALDVNVDTNAFGYRPHQDPRLVSIMAKHGFTWGGRWLTPDGMHFEAAPTGR